MKDFEKIRDELAKNFCEENDIEAVDDGPNEYNFFRDGYTYGAKAIFKEAEKLAEALLAIHKNKHTIFFIKDCPQCKDLTQWKTFKDKNFE